MKIKHFVAVAAVSVVAMGVAQADTTYDLGPISVGIPVSFAGVTAKGQFSDIFEFSMPDNGGSGYSVSNFTLLPSLYDTIVNNLALVSNPDGILFNFDDDQVASASGPSSSLVTLSVGPTPAGKYYLSVMGIGNGSAGGIYTGAISVSAIPEPETYAMMLAGLGVLGFLASRRRRED